jgi:hypothetical protein
MNKKYNAFSKYGDGHFFYAVIVAFFYLESYLPWNSEILTGLVLIRGMSLRRSCICVDFTGRLLIKKALLKLNVDYKPC